MSATGVDVHARLTWSAQHATSFDIYLGTSPNPPKILTDFVIPRATPTLKAATRYYWKVVAKSPSGSSSSAVGLFDTVGRVVPPAAPLVLNLPSNQVITSPIPLAVNWSAPTTAGGIQPIAIVLSLPSGSVFGFGTTSVLVTATSADRQSVSGSFTITVNHPAIPPLVLTCPGNVSVAADVGGAVATYPPPVITGGQAPIVGSYDIPSGSRFPNGQVTTVTYTATSADGQMASCSFLVNVAAVIPPSPLVLTVPPNQSVFSTVPSAMSWAPPTTTGGKGPIVIVVNPISGSTFPFGTTRVSVTATSADGQTAVGSFTITITQIPILTVTCPGNISVAAQTGGAVVTYPDAVITGGIGPLFGSYDIPSGHTFSNGTTTTVTFSASSSDGQRVSCHFTVTVQASIPPSPLVLTVPAPIAVTSAVPIIVNYTAPSTTGGTAPVNIVVSKASGSVFPLGITTVTVTATSTDAQVVTKTFAVTVTAPVFPTLTVTCPGNVSVTTSTGNPVPATYADPVITGGQAPITGSYNIASGSLFPVGVTTVIYTARSTDGQVKTCSLTVTVTSTFVPPFTLTVVSGSGSGTYPAGTVVSIVAASPPAGSQFKQWTGATVANPTASSTTITMPSANTTVTATYAAIPLFHLTVNNGSGTGNYPAGTVVAIVANAPAAGQAFSTWTGSTVASPTSPSTTITMGAAPATVTATYVAVPTFLLTVNSGTGGGSYAAGTVVNLVANIPAHGSVFKTWTGATVFDAVNQETTITMPAAPATVTATYQTIDSGLLGPTDLTYLGAFKLPPGTVGTSSFDFSGPGLTYFSTHNSLFLVGHPFQQQVAEVSIPTPVISANVASLNTAALLQTFRDVMEGRLPQIGNSPSTDTQQIGGLLSYGGRLILAAYLYYDGTGGQTKSHFTSGLVLSTLGDINGPYQVGTLFNISPGTDNTCGFLSAYLGAIPSAWQAALGGPVLAGNGDIPIISRTSRGPSAWAIDPAKLGVVDPIPASPLVTYPSTHFFLNQTETDQLAGVAFPTTHRSVLFFGSSGLGSSCYGEPTNNPALDHMPVSPGSVDIYCYDPALRSKGPHAFPYRYTVWAYDANDLAAVKAGSQNPWDVQPYATWLITLPVSLLDQQLQGVAYDPGTNRIYCCQQYGNGSAPLVHVFQVTIPAPPLFTLTVVNGSGSGNYPAGTVVTIVANTPPAGDVFSAWIGGTVASASSATTTVTMPSAPVTVTATYIVAPGTFYVATTGNNSNPGTIGSPFRTINFGASRLSPGNTLLVRAGTYDESILNSQGVTVIPGGTSWANKVRIAAFPSETVWMRPTGGGISAVIWLVTDTSKFIEFDGINLDASALTDIAGLVTGGIDPATQMAHHIRIQNCEIIRATTSGGCLAGGCPETDGILFGAHEVESTIGHNEAINVVVHGGNSAFGYGIYLSGPNNLVDGCEIFDTSSAGIHIYNGGGDSADNNIVRNNRIHDLTTSGQGRGWGILVSGNNNQIYNNLLNHLSIPGPSNNAGIYVYTGSGNQVYDNTIANNTHTGIWIDGGAAATDVRNNITYLNAEGDYVDGGVGTTQSHNMISGVNPLFVNAGAQDYNLQGGSHARGAGIGIAFISTDILGRARATSGPCDIGAYETP